MRLRACVPALMLLCCCAACAEPRQVAARPPPLAQSAPAAVSRPPAAAPSAAAAQPAAQPDIAAGERIRPSAIAGSWYPNERSVVIAQLSRMLRAASSAPGLADRPVALVVPHAGWRYSGAAAAAAYRNLHPGQFERVVVVGPTHRSQFAGFSVTDYDAYATPLGNVPLCAAAAALRDDEIIRNVSRAHAKEHSIEIQLPFLQHTLGSFCLIPILAGETTPQTERALAAKLAELHDGKTLFVFSSDFVHYGPGYGYTPFGRTAKLARARILALERRAISLLTQPDAAGFRRLLAETSATICGRRGLSVMLELMPRIAPRTRGVLLAHYASSDLPDSDGTDGVWYVALAYARATGKGAPLGAPRNPVACNAGSAPLAAAMGKKLVRIARATLETELRETDDLKRELESPPFSSELSRLQAVFVTLRLRGALRGCVGQLTPQYPLAEAVVRAARNAALRDGRFAAVTPDQVDTLSVEVTALTPLTPVTSWHEIALGRHGILLRHGRRRAVFLPQVPGEQGWTLQQTLDALSRKAGLPAAAWRTPEASFLVFTGQPFRESAETGPLHARRRESP